MYLERLGIIAISFWLGLFAADIAMGADNTETPQVDMDAEIQKLMHTTVTSVSKREEQESQVPAALYVISEEDIRRSGYTSIPDLLRMVPGLQVSQSGSQNWAVASRGFGGQFSNKLLVMIDGRTVYTPVFSGVFWDVQNLMLEDIKQIEVIRGPGATLWGANAVNGVINIITKSAKDTQGTLLSAETGNQVKFGSSARYGGREGDVYYRTYAKYQDNNAEHFSNGNNAGDQWSNEQGGFRVDWAGESKDKATLQSDVYKGQEDVTRFLPVTSVISPSLYQRVNDSDDVSGMNLLGRYKHTIDKDSDVSIQAYYDDVVRLSQDVGIGIHTQTFDVEAQDNWLVNDRNNLTFGMGYRYIDSGFGNSLYINYAPEDYSENVVNTFAQDRIALIQNKLYLTLGSKLEHNDFSGFELEPSARLAYLPSDEETWWTSVSRAVHTPNQSNQDIGLVLASLHSTPTTLVSEQGVPNAQSEAVIAYEAGYRVMVHEEAAIDVTAFYNNYTNLASLTNGSASLQYNSALGYYVYAPLLVGNLNSGETHGMEVATTWDVNSKLRLNANYSFYFSHLDITGASLVTKQGTAPTQQYGIRAYYDITSKWEVNSFLYHTDDLTGLSIPAYTKLDAKIGYKPLDGLEISLVGQNLLRSEHQEYTGFLYENPEEISRSVLLKATMRF